MHLFRDWDHKYALSLIKYYVPFSVTSGQLAINSFLGWACPLQSLSFHLTIGRQFYAHFTLTSLFIPTFSQLWWRSCCHHICCHLCFLATSCLWSKACLPQLCPKPPQLHPAPAVTLLSSVALGSLCAWKPCALSFVEFFVDSRAWFSWGHSS